MNDYTEFEIAVSKYFTASELVEFLDLDIELLFERFEDQILERFDEICEEIGIEPDDVDTE